MRLEKGILLVLACSLGVFTGPAVQAQNYVYPAQGQSPEQQQKDEGECYVWAVQQSGYDPANPQAAAAPPPPGQTASDGGLLRGAARGAALGAVGGAIAGNAGKGAAIGAATGGLIGGFRRHDQQRSQAQAQQNYQAQVQQQQSAGLNSFNRARAACLTGRGYTLG